MSGTDDISYENELSRVVHALRESGIAFSVAVDLADDKQLRVRGNRFQLEYEAAGTYGGDVYDFYSIRNGKGYNYRDESPEIQKRLLEAVPKLLAKMASHYEEEIDKATAARALIEEVVRRLRDEDPVPR